MLVGALEVLLKDNVSTPYVADCSYFMLKKLKLSAESYEPVGFRFLNNPCLSYPFLTNLVPLLFIMISVSIFFLGNYHIRFSSI